MANAINYVPTAPTVPAGLDPTDPKTAALIRAMMQAKYQQEAGQQMEDEGSQDPGATQFVPAANQYAPAMAIRQSPLMGLSRALEKGLGAKMSRDAMDKQIQLQMEQTRRLWQQAQLTGQGQPPQAPPPNGAAGGNGAALGAALASPMPPNPDQMAGGAIPPQALGKAMQAPPPLPQGSPDPSQQGMHPADLAVDPVAASRNAILAQQAQTGVSAGQRPDLAFGLGGQPPQAPPEAAPPQAPPPAVNQLSTGAPQPQSQFDPSVYAARNAISPALGEAYLKANGPQPPTNTQLEARDPQVLQYEQQKAAATSGANAQNEPATYTDANGQTHQTNKYALAHQNDVVQSPAQAKGAETAQTNVQAYREGLNRKVGQGADQARIMNAQEDLMTHFRPGANEEDLAKAAAAAETLGASPALVSQIARGDQSAVGAVQAFSAMASLHAAKQALEAMGGEGTATPRIGQAVYQSFKDNLSNPDNREEAIKAINALSRQQYAADLKEQQAAYADKGDPTTFQSRYAAQIAPGLLAGRSTDPAAAILQTGNKTPPVTLTAPPLMANRVKGQVYQTPKGPMTWTGSGWQNAQ